ncbi:MAG: IS66 family insertion sequence element accessory protein TnpA [Bacteroidota bacterium]
MRHHIDICSKSGLTVAEYCLQNGIVKSGYYYWSKKLQGENKAPGFTAISIVKSGGATFGKFRN